MAYKIGRAIKPKAQNSFTLKDYFGPNASEVISDAIYWLLVNKVAVMVAGNRTGTSVCLTLYQDKGKEPLWANTPEEFLDLLIKLATEASEAAREDGLT